MLKRVVKSDRAMLLTTTVRRCREAGASVVCGQGYRAILRYAGGLHGDWDRPVNLLDVLDGKSADARLRNVLGGLRVTEQDSSPVACLIVADIFDWARRNSCANDDAGEEIISDLRLLAADPNYRSKSGLTREAVVDDAEQIALSVAGRVMKQAARAEWAVTGNTESAQRAGEWAWESAWLVFARIMRRYLLESKEAQQ